MPPKKAEHLVEAVETRLRFLKEIGVEDVAASPARAPRTARPAAAGTDPAAEMRALDEEVRVCTKCRLSSSRTRAVPGEGSVSTELMFVGEGPGRDEDQQGRPFVGRAGQLLTKIIAAMTYDRSSVYITNIVKCRPPDNRVPQRDEVAACTPYLLRQIGLLRPRVLVTLGKTATDTFLPGIAGGMTSIRGRFYDWNGLKVMPTFHPSYLVRNEGNREIKKMVWDDMQQVMAFLGRR